MSSPGSPSVQSRVPAGFSTTLRHQREDARLSAREALEERDLTLGALAEIEAQQVPERDEPERRAERGRQRQLEHPRDGQREGRQHSELHLRAQLGEGEHEEAETEPDRDEGDRPDHRAQRRRGGLGLVAEAARVESEAREVVHGVVDRDAERDRADQARREIERHVEEPEHAVVDRDRQQVRQQREETDPERQEQRDSVR